MRRTVFNEDHEAFRQTLRDFIQAEVVPVYQDWYAAGIVPREFYYKLAGLGLFGIEVPEEYGGAGITSFKYNAIESEELSLAGVSFGGSGVHTALCLPYILKLGTEAQKERWLPPMARGEVVGCFGLTEPDFGSNPSGMLTTAVRDGDGFRLNGTKRWITNGSIAQLALVWAKLDGEVRGFLVPTSAPGFSARDIHGKWSLRASVTSELILEDCRVGADALMPGVKGLKGPLSCLTQARFGIAFGAVGAMLACYDEALGYAQERVQFSRPIAGYQLVQEKLVVMVNEITKAQLLDLRLGRLKEKGALRPQHVSLAKRNNVYWAREIARTARDVLGANGVTDEYQCGRHMLNLESVYTYEGTHDIHTLVVGQDITGHAAFDG
jgi:glutaryl-CoA dehydrogenase